MIRRTHSIARTSLALVFALASTQFERVAHAQSAPDTWELSVTGASGKDRQPRCASGLQCITTITDAGGDTSNTADRLTYVNGTLTGDGTLVTRVEAFDHSDSDLRAGVMVRESSTAGAKHVFAYAVASGGLGFQTRATTNGVRSTGFAPGTSLPVWLKLERVADQFTMYRSDDGAEWTVVAQATVTMAPTVRVGLAVSGRANRKTLERFSRTSLAGKLPRGWETADVGDNPGGATYQAGGRLVVVSAGEGIGGNTDDFHYTFRRVTSDVDIIARVATIRGVKRQGTAGLMIRRSLHPSAANASILVTPRGGVSFERRLLANTGAIDSDGGTDGAPVWLKLERRGDRISSLRSADGLTWTPVGEDTVPLGEEIYVGLVMASQDSTQMASANFDGIDVKELTGGSAPSNAAPTVTLSSPSGTTITAGAPLVLQATASDSDGSITGVDFVVNGAVRTTVSTVPYTTSWTPAAGDYVIVAVAKDNGGATATSESLSVSVKAAEPVTKPNVAPTISLGAPVQGAAAVAGTPIAIVANASDSDGSIAAVDFLVNGSVVASVSAAPYTTTWTPAAGDYVLTATARDDKGATATSASVSVTVSAPALPPAPTPDPTPTPTPTPDPTPTPTPTPDPTPTPVPTPRLLIFTASSDDSLVAFYQLQVFRSDNLSGSPVLTLNLGKPTPVNGEITVDVTTAILSLPAGSYVAVVQAVGTGGTSSSTPSPSFAR